MPLTKIFFRLVIYLGLLLAVAACQTPHVAIAAQPTATPGPTATLTPPPPATPTNSPEPSPSVTRTPTPTRTAIPTAIPTATACACNQSCPCPIRYVVIISIDGLRPDAVAQADTPILKALRAKGAYARAAWAVLPSVTLINHASMLSGMSPAKHGITWNVDDSDLGKVKGPTVFSVVHEAGLKTAMIVGKPKLEHLVLPDTVDNYIYAGYTDQQVVDQAVAVIKSGLPDLLFIHLPDVDSAGHALGWMSLGQLLAVSHTDSLIGNIVTALAKQDYLSQTLLIITSDHGGLEYLHGGDSPEETTIFWLAVGPGVPAGRTLSRPIITYDTAATALYALGLPIPAKWDGQPVREIFEQSP